MDGCVEAYEYEYEKAFEVIEYDSIRSMLEFDALGEEIDIFDMTSLSTLMLLSQTDSKSPHFDDSLQQENNDYEKYRLSLAYERLHRMPKLLLNELSSVITILDLSYNEFENLEFLGEFKHLTTLICDHNNINSSCRLPYLPRLELLWMNHCKIDVLFPWATKLHQSCPNLKHLSLMGNRAAPSYLNGGSFYEHLQYRLFMISLFPTLNYLDDKAVTEDQRIEADRMFRRPLLERLASKTPAIFPIYFRSVTDKVSEMFSQAPSFAAPQKNGVI